MAASPRGSSAAAAELSLEQLLGSFARISLDDLPAKPSAAAAVSVSEAVALPADVLRSIFSLLDCDVRSLSSAACVCTSWRAAALDPCHWRLACLTFAPRAARHLTDGALAALVRRTGSSLEAINLAGCTAVTVAGVAAALQGKKLKTLAVRGVKSIGPRQTKNKAAASIAKLRALVRRPTGLDFRATVSCSNPKSCTRLCGPQDVLCSPCNVVRCAPCTASAKAKRLPPCSHLCDGCFVSVDQLGYQLVACPVCGRVPNGFCRDCTRECSYCDAFFCEGCSLSGGALTKCAEPSCTTMYCDDDRPAPQCDVCGANFCEDCFVESLALCDFCEDTCYCHACVDPFLTGGSVMCAQCLEDMSDDDPFWSDDESGSD